METITLELPDFWATALFYDDTSGFEYEDEKPFQEFCQWAVKNYGTSEPVEVDEARSLHDLPRCKTVWRPSLQRSQLYFYREQWQPDNERNDNPSAHNEINNRA